jgi:hypothetical protein
MTDPSIRERVVLGIIHTFVDGGHVSTTTVAARSGISRQRIHDAGLRTLIVRFATAQRELAHGSSQLAAGRISALRAEVELVRQASAPPPLAHPSPENDALVEHLRGRIHTLENEVARLQDEIIAERNAVKLLLQNTD